TLAFAESNKRNSSFKNEGDIGKYYFGRENKNIKLCYLIQLFECFCSDCTNCTCYFFLDKAICYHIVACCLLDDINYLGLKDKQFVIRVFLKKERPYLLFMFFSTSSYYFDYKEKKSGKKVSQQASALISIKIKLILLKIDSLNVAYFIRTFFFKFARSGFISKNGNMKSADLIDSVEF
ncbi:hypothetical protein BpHYR1_033294, partial [Brachionus plicatilis]